MRSHRFVLFAFATLLSLSACETLNSIAPTGGDTSKFPKTEEDRRKERLGKLTGDEGFVLGGGSKKNDEAANPLGVNSFLWRATLDTLSFLPLASADPFGGVVLTDWYEDPKAPGERFKVNALILDRQLRADSIKISVFKQRKVTTGQWQDIAVEPTLPRKLEDAVLTRARELRVAQLGY